MRLKLFYSCAILDVRWAAVTLLLMLAACSTGPSPHPSNGQKNFTSPRQAVTALVVAVGDNDDAELLALLGSGSENLIASGDPVADRNARLRFLKAYGEQNKLERDKGGRMLLVIGKQDYPFPIPLVRQSETWRFDTPAGTEEILDRRIGRNELRTVEVVQAYTDAQREYAALQRNGNGPEFAQKFASSEGQRDGLYWEANEGEAESPFGPLLAQATEAGYAGGLERDPPEAFNGYFFKILKAQGPNAKGGAFDYRVDGKMLLGFALVAYPAKYGASGIMTFIVNQEGVIYEKDLGENSAATAAAMTCFDPDPSWRPYRESSAEASR